MPLADETVDLIITSPPYWALRSYQDDGEHYDGQIGSEANASAFLWALWKVTDECWRVLKPTGSLFVNLGDKYAGSGGPGTTTKLFQTAAIRRAEGMARYQQAADVPAKSLMGLPWRYALGLTCPMTYRTDTYDDRTPQWTLRAEIVWSKPNGLPESVTDRVRRSHEQWFHFTKRGQYYAAVDEVRETYSAGASERRQRYAGNAPAADYYGKRDVMGLTAAEHPLGKLPSSVWTIPSEPLAVPDHLGVDHFAAFPTEWPRRVILGWSPPAGIVLDPFVGTGTVPMVARTLGRYGVGLDLSRDYLRLARWRVFRSGHGRKAMSRTDRERQGALW